MRLLVTADLHFNHRVSKPLAEQVINEMNRAGGEGVLVVGDTGVADGESIEQCLSLFRIAGLKLFLAGNHELWTLRDDSYSLFQKELPRRVEAIGWQWLQRKPIRIGSTSIVGNIGWYDYSFAEAHLAIPHRFYERGVSPGAAARLSQFNHLFAGGTDDISPAAMKTMARWNDGRFVKLGRTNAEFLDENLSQLELQLESCRDAKRVFVAVHHVPFCKLLPPRHGAQWDFARAYLGSEKIGQLISRFPNVDTVLCGHSHIPAETMIGPIRAINIGSGYRHKHFLTLDIVD